MTEVKTWRDLYLFLHRHAQTFDVPMLDGPIQIFPPTTNGNVPVSLLPVISIGTVREFCADEQGQQCETTANAQDGGHSPDQFVLLADVNQFAEASNQELEVPENAATDAENYVQQSDAAHSMMEAVMVNQLALFQMLGYNVEVRGDTIILSAPGATPPHDPG